MTIEAAELLNESVTAGGAAVVRVDLANTDPAQGDLVLRLSANGTNVTEERLAVAASTERTVYVRATFDSPGTYQLDLNGNALGALAVTGTTGTPTSTPTATSVPTATPTATDESVVTPRPTTAEPAPTTTSGDGVGFGAVAAILAVALAALGRRR